MNSWIVIILVLLFIFVLPVFTIMSLNTLFNTGIDLTIWTWLSTVWLTGIVAGGSKVVTSYK